MIALSGAFHVALGVLALAVSSIQGPTFRLQPVAVVDLVGGGEFRETGARQPGPAPKPAVREKAPPPKKAGKPPKAAARKPAPAARPEDYSTARKRTADESSVAERLRQMREARAGSDAVRGAVEERRRESAARAAVRSVGERVAHRVEAPKSPSAAGAFGGGAQGTVRLSAELREYFRKLEESVRGNWVLPEALVRNAGKLMVEMRIVIEKDGKVSDARIEKGSGNVYFDESVRRAIRKASPLPVPPEQLRGGEDHYEVGFRFHGAGGAG
ncbi:MAG: TonB C-terminal domain-containing protein [Deltaproteobacteria bacterium]|nr:TonB C-terminal domain-containing protein [Deltaproteobacteria bacterium]